MTVVKESLNPIRWAVDNIRAFGVRNTAKIIAAGAIAGEVLFHGYRIGVEILSNAHVISEKAPALTDPNQLWVAGALALIMGLGPASDFGNDIFN